MKGDLSFEGAMRPKVTRGPSHTGWRRIITLILDWVRRGR